MKIRFLIIARPTLITQEKDKRKLKKIIETEKKELEFDLDWLEDLEIYHEILPD